MIAAAVLLEEARRHVGEPYVLGARAPMADATYRGPWDCAEFVTWCLVRATGRLYGCADNQAPLDDAEAWTGFWRRDVESGVEERGAVWPVSVAAAMRTPGAILLRYPPGTGIPGHIAFSTGDGGTLEALNRASGVVTGRAIGRRWDIGVEIPGVVYGPFGPRVSVAPETLPAIVRLGDTGSRVLKVQAALARAGLELDGDGDFGPQTLAAVVEFQRSAGLVVDGEVGPETRRALSAAARR